MTTPATGASVPGWALRVALGVAGIAAALIVTRQADLDAAGGMGTILVLLAVGAAAAPGSVCPLLLLLGVIAVRLAAPHPFDAALVALVILVPLVHQLAGLGATIPARSACRWRALAPAALRFAIAVIPVCLVAIVLAEM